MYARKILLLTCGVAFWLVAEPNSAAAVWQLSKLTNNSNQIISFSLPLTAGATVTSDKAMVRGDLGVVVPGQGVVTFIDKGHNTRCNRPYWGVEITFNDKHWGFFYDGAGTIEMTVNDNGTVSFVAGHAGQVVVGSGPARCH